MRRVRKTETSIFQRTTCSAFFNDNAAHDTDVSTTLFVPTYKLPSQPSPMSPPALFSTLVFPSFEACDAPPLLPLTPSPSLRNQRKRFLFPTRTRGEERSPSKAVCHNVRRRALRHFFIFFSAKPEEFIGGKRRYITQKASKRRAECEREDVFPFR